MRHEDVAEAEAQHFGVIGVETADTHSKWNHHRRRRDLF